MSKTKHPIAPPAVAKIDDTVASTPAAEVPSAEEKTTPKPSAASRKAAAKPAAPKAASTKAEKPVSTKLVRDSFTFPKTEYDVLVAMKKRLLAAGVEVKKGELMRAGLALLNGLDDAALTAALGNVQKLKTGRPAK